MALDRMTLEQFTREIGDRLEAFERTTKAAQAEGVDGFVGDRFERRTFDDWMAEFEAHEGVTQVVSRINAARTADRRKNFGQVERRNFHLV